MFERCARAQIFSGQNWPRFGRPFVRETMAFFGKVFVTWSKLVQVRSAVEGQHSKLSDFRARELEEQKSAIEVRPWCMESRFWSCADALRCAATERPCAG